MTQKDSLAYNLNKVARRNCHSHITKQTSENSVWSTQESLRTNQNPENWGSYDRTKCTRASVVQYIPMDLPIQHEQAWQHRRIIIIKSPQPTINHQHKPPSRIHTTRAELAIIEEQHTIRESVQVQKSSINLDGPSICSDAQQQGKVNPQTKRPLYLNLLDDHIKVRENHGTFKTHKRHYSEQQSAIPSHKKKLKKLRCPRNSLKIRSLVVEMLNSNLSPRSHQQNSITIRSASPRSTRPIDASIIKSQDKFSSKYLCLTPRQSPVKNRFTTPSPTKKGIHLVGTLSKSRVGSHAHPPQQLMRSTQLPTSLTSSRMTDTKCINLNSLKPGGSGSKKIQVRSLMSDRCLRTPNQ